MTAVTPRIERMLVVRLSSLGDVLLVTPALRSLRRAFPGAEITFVVDERFAAVLRHNPHVDRLIETRARGRRLPHGWLAGLGALDGRVRRRFDLAVDLHGKRRSAGWIYASFARTMVGRSRRAWPLWRAVVAPDPSVHEVDLGLRVAAAAGAAPAGSAPELFLDPAADRRVSERLAELGVDGSRFVSIVPFTRWPSKNWPLERFAAILPWLRATSGAPVLILGGPDDRAAAASLVAGLAPSTAISLAGELALAESLCLCGRGRLMIAGDTGLMHAAAALGTPLVALFGPTLPEHTGPRGLRQEIVQASRPDSHRAYLEDREARHIRAIEPDSVRAAVQRMLGS